MQSFLDLRRKLLGCNTLLLQPHPSFTALGVNLPQKKQLYSIQIWNPNAFAIPMVLYYVIRGQYIHSVSMIPKIEYFISSALWMLAVDLNTRSRPVEHKQKINGPAKFHAQSTVSP